MLSISAGAAWTFGLLTLAILLVWSRPRRRRLPAWALGLALALAAGLLAGIIDWRGLGWLGLFAGCLSIRRTTPSEVVRGAASLGALALGAGLTLHVLPGFSNPQVLPPTVLKDGAVTYSKYLNLDKGVLGLLFLGLASRPLKSGREWVDLSGRVLMVGAPLVTVLMAGSLAMGYVRLDLSVPTPWLFWIWTNLLFTCLAEEALFRGVLQAELQHRFRNRSFGSLAALLAASVIFGLAHAAGGATYVLLSAVAGFGYGWVYQRTGRIEASMLCHFLVNAVHFFAFTYPALSGS